MNLSELFAKLIKEGVEQVQDWDTMSRSDAVHRAIGYDYIASRQKGSGTQIEYTDRDLRRAVAHFRLVEVAGIAMQTQSQRMYAVIKNVAMGHTDGYVYFDGEQANWVFESDDPEVLGLIQAGRALVLVPCYLETEDPNYGTVAVETDET